MPFFLLFLAAQIGGSRALAYPPAESTSFRLTPTDTLMSKPTGPAWEGKVYVFADPRRTFQPFIGIGGALTDAAAETFAKLPAARQDELITAYYSTVPGIGYTLGRTNIHSCDFSSESYTYVTEGDKDLTSFSIAHDLRYRIPLIKRAMAASGNQLKLFASPWSPPAYMKDNNDMLNGGHLRPEYAHAWALYFAKFVASYRKEGVPVWGITIQNEPMATQKWESCVFQASDERDFLKHHLGPVMAQQGLLGNVNIIVWDHNRDLIIQRALAIFDDSAATKYAWGIGFHWYEDWSGGQQMYGNVALVSRLYPDKHILFTEGTPASFDSNEYGRWSLGEAYGRSMINDFNSGAEGQTLCAAALDPEGVLQCLLRPRVFCRASGFGVLPRHTRGFAPPYPPSRFRSSGHGADRIRLRSAAHVLLGVTLALAGGAARVGAQMEMGPGHTEGSARPLGVPEQRAGSGTSWLPDATPMHAIHLAWGSWTLMTHGAVFLQFDDQGGPRGGSPLGVVNWGMLAASRGALGGRLHLRLMLSAEPFTIGARGYPLLLQTGEEYGGAPLVDRQHPHDLFMELAALYERRIADNLAASIYLAPVGEPALGPPAFPHRPSASSDPLAPLSHHWQDATHITFGVITAGLFTRSVKVEGSVFNGREPDENRTDFDYAGRRLHSYTR